MNGNRWAISTLTMLFALGSVALAAVGLALAPEWSTAWLQRFFGLDVLHPALHLHWRRLAEGVAGWTLLLLGVAVLGQMAARLTHGRTRGPIARSHTQWPRDVTRAHGMGG